MKTRSVKITGAMLSLCLIFTSFAACGSPVSDTSDPLPEHYGSALWDAEELFSHKSCSFTGEETFFYDADESMIVPACFAVNGKDVYVFDLLFDRLAVFKDGQLSFKTECWSYTDTMCVHGGRLYAYEFFGESVRVYDLDGDPEGTIPLSGLTGIHELTFDGPPPYADETLFSDGSDLKFLNKVGDVFHFDFGRNEWINDISVTVKNPRGGMKTLLAGDMKVSILLGTNTEMTYCRHTDSSVTIGVKKYDRQGSASYDHSIRIYDASGELVSFTKLYRYDKAAVDAALESGDLSGIYGAEVYIDSNGDPYALIFENGIFRVTKPNMRSPKDAPPVMESPASNGSSELVSLSIDHTPVTSEQLSVLQKALPETQIHCG